MNKSFPFYQQPDQMDCGATCLRMIAKYYGKNYSLETLRQKTSISREGVSLLGISEAAEQIGFRTMGVRVPFEKVLSRRDNTLLTVCFSLRTKTNFIFQVPHGTALD